MRIFDAIRQDARYALRMLLQNPGFSSVAVLSLALGIGANTAIFTLIDTVLLRSLPVRDPEQLVVFALNPEKPSPFTSYPDYRYLRDHNQSFSGVIAHSGNLPVSLAIPAEGGLAAPEMATVTQVSGNYFDVLGVTPAIGRMLTADDDKTEGAHPWLVLDYGFWRQRFGGDPRAVGMRVTVNGSPFTIVGVARSGFTGTVLGNHPDLYAPITMLRQIRRGDPPTWNSRHFTWLRIEARLKPGVSRNAAIPEMNVLWKQNLASDPEQRPVAAYDKDYEQRNRATLLDGSGGYSYLRGQFQRPLMVLMVVVALVLLIACANVANLLLARAAARRREIAIRLAIGAGRARLVSQLILESIVIALAGGMAGAALAWWGVRVLMAFLPKRGNPIQLDLSPDWRVLVFSFGVCLAVGVVCGLIPALQATRPNLTSALKTEAAAGSRVRFDLRRALVIAQVATSLLLLIGAGLFLRSLQNLRTIDPGFARERVLMTMVHPQQVGYKGQQTREFYERLLARVQTLPEVRSASLADVTPLGDARWINGISVEGYQRRADEKPFVDSNAVSPGYFETLGIQMLQGRDFRPEDNPAVSAAPDFQSHDGDRLPPPQPVAIVNQAMARKYFPNQNPIGKRFSRGEKFDLANAFEIIGVVRDANYFNLREAVESMIYLPVWRLNASDKTLCVRTNGPPESLGNAIRREIASIDPAIPVLQTLTLEDQFDNTISQERTVTSLSSFFGALAVLLAAIGLYGVMAHSVTQRYREIGIRMALGAQRKRVLWLVLRDTAWMIGIGSLIGLPAAFGLTRLVQSLLYGLTPQDPLSIVMATVGLILVTGIAGYIPARRATLVDPMVALRYD